MGKKFWRRPSPALVISMLALVLAASGSAVAASRLVSGNSLIKVNSLSGNRLKSGSVTGKQIKASTLGTVPSAVTAQTATTAVTATTANTATTATTAGSAPIAKVTYATASQNISSANSPLAVTATCPSGTTAIGGGGQVADESGSAFLDDSYPTSGKNGWTADFVEVNASPTAATVTAICAPAAATS
jgi:hypothetical protein